MSNFELDLRIGKLLDKQMLVFRTDEEIYAHNSLGFPVEWHPSVSWTQANYALKKYGVEFNLVTPGSLYSATCRGARGEGSTLLIAGLRAILAAEDRDNAQTSFTETDHKA